MADTPAQSQQFTGLILLTGTDKPGIAATLFETLAPFAVSIIDVEQVVNNNRLILTVLIGANPAHQNAIEVDLNECALALGVDIATLFDTSAVTPSASDLLSVSISASKLHPKAVYMVMREISTCGGNIERINRITSEPVSIALIVSGCSKSSLAVSLSTENIASEVTVTIEEVV
jgi:phosphoserine phosphatase